MATPSPSSTRTKSQVPPRPDGQPTSDGNNTGASTSTATPTTYAPRRKSGRAATFPAAGATSDAYQVPAPPDNASSWHSLPLAFAVLPAMGGMFFPDGGAFVTDIMLLLLLAVFLHWLIKFPWEWYAASQALGFRSDPDSSALHPDPADPVQDAAVAEMRRNELVALSWCFLGPLVGGVLLHALRNQLSRPSEGLVSNFNLTIFVLAAELRPAAQVIQLMRARSLHLHRLVRRPPRSRVDDMERRVDSLAADVRELISLTRRAVDRDPDVDALNRTPAPPTPRAPTPPADNPAGAVRRYEKKEALHSAQTESRIVDINSRLNDVIALAAAASSQQVLRRGGGGGGAEAFSQALARWAVGLAAMPFELAWKVAVELPTSACETVARTAGNLLVRGRVGMSTPPKKRESVNGTPAVRAAKGKARLKAV